MFRLPCWRWSLGALLSIGLSSCVGTVSDGGGPPPGEVLPPVYAPAGIRRLSQHEAEIAANALVGVPTTVFAEALGSDARQSGFTRNGDQRIGSVQADALWQAAQAIARQAATQRLQALAPCAAAAGSEACASSFISSFGAKAFRRTLTTSEQEALLTVYRAGKLDSTYAAGIELVIAAVLQSGSFLYVTELGPASPPAADRTSLTGEEIATSLALLFTGLPADEALMTRGRNGELDTSEARAAVARELLALPAARAQVERLILEWQGSDALETLPKDNGLYPEWGSVRQDMLAESRWIIDDVLFNGDGTLSSLLGSPRTSLTARLASFYQVPSPGMVTQPDGRRGLLLAGAFPAANSHPNSTAPVKRGAVVRRKLLCQDLPLPSAAAVAIVIPPPDPTKTTRERFAVHSASESCAGCHRLLDPIGFAFESFDPIGRYRTMEEAKPIDPSGELVGAGDATGPFANAAELSALLARSKTVGECFQRQVYRFASGHSDEALERTFIDFVHDRPSATEGKVVELLVDYVRSDSFVIRSTQ